MTTIYKTNGALQNKVKENKEQTDVTIPTKMFYGQVCVNQSKTETQSTVNTTLTRRIHNNHTLSDVPQTRTHST